MENEIIDQLGREGLKRVSAANLELKARVEYLALELEKMRNESREITQTAEQDKLTAALAKAKDEMAKVMIEKTGHRKDTGSYATVDDLRLFIDPILSKYGLTFVTEPIERGTEDFLRSKLSHDSGQWNSSVSRIRVNYNGERDPLQAYGKALTYMKKYVYGAYFMIHTGGEKE